jgi:hypothetical protein
MSAIVNQMITDAATVRMTILGAALIVANEAPVSTSGVR